MNIYEFRNILTHGSWDMFYLRNHNHFYHEINRIYENIYIFLGLLRCTYNGGTVFIVVVLCSYSGGKQRYLKNSLYHQWNIVLKLFSYE